MSIKDILLATYIALSKLPKSKLLKAFQSLREKYTELEKTISQLKSENAKLHRGYPKPTTARNEI